MKAGEELTPFAVSVCIQMKAGEELTPFAVSVCALQMKAGEELTSFAVSVCITDEGWRRAYTFCCFCVHYR